MGSANLVGSAYCGARGLVIAPGACGCASPSCFRSDSRPYEVPATTEVDDEVAPAVEEDAAAADTDTDTGTAETDAADATAETDAETTN